MRLVERKIEPILAGLCLCLISLSCDHITGPPLTAEVVREALVPSVADPATADNTTADPISVCCCGLTGVVKNTSTIPVSVSLRWRAFNVGGGVIGSALTYVDNIPVGGQKSFVAAGIFDACSRVSRLDRTQLVIGLFTP